MKLGIISDTHGYMDDRILKHLEGCDEIWHAGDIGHPSVTARLASVNTVEAVHGNIDNTQIRAQFPEHVFKNIEGTRVLMIHIAGAMSKYNATVQHLLLKYNPQLLICGHSHILKVAFDKRFNLLYLNPGAAGRHGFHKTRTLVRVDVNDTGLKNCEVVELGPRSSKTVD